ncbi:MAG: YhfC family intramembrane metalloprotease [Roseburia sp.]|nr:YhfC family intramembrane metalloprotease [Roseburia sp.]
MVGTSTIIAACITLFVALVLPLIIYIVYGVKNKGKGVWTAWLLGAAGFFVFQIIIRVPILNVLSLSEGFVSFATEHYIVYCLLLAFTAALFEVAGRYIVAKLMRANLTYERGIAAGLGHGGIEAMMLIGMTYINNLVYIALINSGSFDTVVEQTAALGVDTSSLVSVKEALIGTESYVFLLAGYERILTMILHVVLSLLVCYFVSRGKDWQGIVTCLVCHWLVDFVSAAVSGIVSGTVAYVIIYIFLTIVAVVSVLGIRSIKRSWKNGIKGECC